MPPKTFFQTSRFSKLFPLILGCKTEKYLSLDLLTSLHTALFSLRLGIARSFKEDQIISLKPSILVMFALDFHKHPDLVKTPMYNLKHKD